MRGIRRDVNGIKSGLVMSERKHIRNHIGKIKTYIEKLEGEFFEKHEGKFDALRNELGKKY